MSIRFKTIYFAIAVLLSACSEPSSEIIGEVVRPVKYMQVAEPSGHINRYFPGEAKAADAVTLAFEVSGKLSKILVDVGDQVKQGQTIAELDPRDFENALDQAIAELARSEIYFNRVTIAAKENAVSQQELSDALAAVKSASALVNIRRKALDDTKIIAPYDAIVTHKHFESFSNINAKQGVVRLIDPSKIEMTTYVSEDLISFVNNELEVLVRFDLYPQIEIPATVHEISLEASSVTGSYPITLSMKQPDGIAIIPGMTGVAWRANPNDELFNSSKMKGVEVPTNAILSESEGENFVWVVSEPNNIIKKKAISLGELTSKGVLITGLTGNEKIVTAGIHELSEGQQVRLVASKKL